jgi:hypothetical protein
MTEQIIEDTYAYPLDDCDDVYILQEEEEKYCGPISCGFATILTLLFFPLALLVPVCPCDSKKNYKFKKMVNKN